MREFLLSELKCRMFYRFKYIFVDLSNSKNGIFLQLLDSKDFINILTEIHPFNSLLTAAYFINSIGFDYFFEFFIWKGQIKGIKNSSKL